MFVNKPFITQSFYDENNFGFCSSTATLNNTLVTKCMNMELSLMTGFTDGFTNCNFNKLKQKHASTFSNEFNNSCLSFLLIPITNIGIHFKLDASLFSLSHNKIRVMYFFNISDTNINSSNHILLK